MGNLLVIGKGISFDFYSNVAEMDCAQTKGGPIDELIMEIPYSHQPVHAVYLCNLEMVVNQLINYFSNLSDGVKTTLKGMLLAISYFFKAGRSRQKEYVTDDGYYEKATGIFTVQYPKESIPIPDNGRYQLHNEIDDCIVCDKCAKICPVDCIDIVPVRSPDVFGRTSDGTPLRIHAAKFDIDMSKCCFCGLCTVVCPTECLTMTKEFDFSTSNISDHNFSFSKMSEQEIAEKKKVFDDHQKQKAKTVPQAIGNADVASEKSAKKLVFKPKVTGVKPLATTGSKPDSNEVQQPKKPLISTKIPGKA